MPFNYHVNLPGPVSYTRPVRKKRKGSGPLTTLLVWFIVKPVELIFRGLAALFTSSKRPKAVKAPQFPAGWYQTPYGYRWWNGAHWVRPDGQIMY